MHPNAQALAAGLMVIASTSTFAASHYVNANSFTPASPYTDWSSAASTIQDAVDVSISGDEIVVTNGIYATGGRIVYTSFSNRVAVTKPLFVHSVDGPQVTVIQGYQVPGTTNGPGAIRCVYLTNGATLSGFTLTNGGTLSGLISSNDYSRQQLGGGVWCESGSMVSNCVIIGNAATDSGAGAYGGTLHNCILSGNSTGAGGQTFGFNPNEGGGAYLCTLSNCTLSGNLGFFGGGASQSTLNNCTLRDNLASYGGGAFYCTLNNCLLVSNSAVQIGFYTAGAGGGTYDCTLRNCTLTGNSAPSHGGVYYGSATNCIVFFNTAPTAPNFDTDSALSYCCTIPLPAGSTGSITNDPLFIDLAGGNLHLQSNSPCINSGNNAFVAAGPDLDGNPRVFGGAVDLGAYEFQGSSTGVPPYIISPPASQSTTVGAGASFNVFAGGSSPLQYQWIFNGGNITGATASSLILTNVQLSQSGTYTVAITNIAGSNTSSDAVLAVYLPGTRYVDVNSANPTVPYTNWSHAARRIQDAIDVAAPGDELVVTNGIYASGGRAVSGSMTNRAALYKPLTLHSVNGPQFTIIQGRQVPGTTNGDGAIRCAYLTNGATLSGFTLTNGATRTAGDGNFEKLGGGLWCENSGTVSNCVLVNNSAVGGGGMLGGALDNCALVGNSAWFGGATVGGTLRNCTLIGNSATDEGGGAWNSTLNNCSLIGNSASNSAGGAWLGTLTNCTLRNNWAASGGGVYIGTLVNCTLTSNWATNGGGAADATLINCLLAGNSASDSGGGALSGTLVNCTLTANSAGVQGGGVGARYSSDSSALTNCIVYFNTSPFGANFNPTNTALNYCCTTPLPSGGNGNIINDPLFVDQAGGNLRLQSNSPCIDAGNNTYAPAGPDLDGHPRITGSSVDIGAYEFYPSPSLRIARSPGNVTLAWQLWGSNFVLQCVSSLPSTPGGWSNVSAQVIVVGGENAVTLPANHSSKYFRLSLP